MDTGNLQRLLQAYRGLVEISHLINSITEYDVLLTRVLEVARKVAHAEASSLFLHNASTGDLELVIARGPDGEIDHAHVVIPRGTGIAGWTLEHEQPVLIPDAYSDPRFYREVDQKSGFTTRSILCVPLMRDREKIGVLQVLNAVDKRGFDETDLEIFQAFSSLVVTAMIKLRAEKQQLQQQRLAADLELAAELQLSFLPDKMPAHPGAEYAAFYRPARNIGGDFYDIIALSPTDVFFVLGDVSGKGVPAALVMAQTLSLLRLALAPGLTSSEALRRLNQAMAERELRRMFVTAIIGRFNPLTGEMEYASAGHHPPVLARAECSIKLPCESALPLGVLPDVVYPTNRIILHQDEAAVFFSDGLCESFSPDRELFGTERIHSTIARAPHSATAIVEALVEAETAHRRDTDPSDDLAILAIVKK